MSVLHIHAGIPTSRTCLLDADPKKTLIYLFRRRSRGWEEWEGIKGRGRGRNRRGRTRGRKRLEIGGEGRERERKGVGVGDGRNGRE